MSSGEETQVKSLIGRSVRFDGKYAGTEGIVLDAYTKDRYIDLIIERTYHPTLPAQIDDAHPIVLIRFDFALDGVIFVKPQTSREYTSLKQLVLDYMAASRAWSWARRTDSPDRAMAKTKIDAAFSALQQALAAKE